MQGDLESFIGAKMGMVHSQVVTPLDNTEQIKTKKRTWETWRE
jgi:hypothetical protein